VEREIVLNPLTPGCRIGYVDRTGCRQPVSSTMRRARRAVTPGVCQIGHVDHTGYYRKLVFRLK
jgi:hypothetical protein